MVGPQEPERDPARLEPRVAGVSLRTVAISTGGITEECGEPKQCLLRVMRRVRQFAPRQPEDTFVDLAFRSWDPRKDPEFMGVQPAMVGRKQRRFIVWHPEPVGLGTDQAVTDWLVSVLPETARLCREHLPTKSRAYPAGQLAQEVEQLAAHLSATSGECRSQRAERRGAAGVTVCCVAAHLTRRDGSMTPYREDADLLGLLTELDAQGDQEHPDVAVTHESGWTLTAFPSGLLVWENVEDDGPVKHTRKASRAEVRRLLAALAHGDLAAVEATPWREGYGA